MKVTGNDVGTVMKYSGHKMLESFSNYIHPTVEDRIVSMQALDIKGYTYTWSKGQTEKKLQ